MAATETATSTWARVRRNKTLPGTDANSLLTNQGELCIDIRPPIGWNHMTLVGKRWNVSEPELHLVGMLMLFVVFCEVRLVRWVSGAVPAAQSEGMAPEREIIAYKAIWGADKKQKRHKFQFSLVLLSLAMNSFIKAHAFFADFFYLFGLLRFDQWSVMTLVLLLS